MNGREFWVIQKRLETTLRKEFFEEEARFRRTNLQKGGSKYEVH